MSHLLGFALVTICVGEKEHDMPPGMRTAEVPDPNNANAPKSSFEDDDPDALWDEWEENEESRKFPKRQREITLRATVIAEINAVL